MALGSLSYLCEVSGRGRVGSQYGGKMSGVDW